MILLDTNVISELMRPIPDSRIVDWAARQNIQDICTSAVNEAELRYGAEILPEGRRRSALLEEIERMLEEDFARRILPFDSAAAQSYAEIAASRRADGRPIDHTDCMIAAIPHVYGASSATRDVGDSLDASIEVINPWAD